MNEQTERTVKIIILIFGAFFIFFVTFLLPKGIFKLTYDYVVWNIIRVSGMSQWLVKGIVILLMIPFLWALCEIFKIKFRIKIFGKTLVKSYRKFAGIIIIVYISLFFLGMHFLSRDKNFDFYNKEPLKWYAETPEGIRFFDSDGYDPVYGIKLKQITQEISEIYKRQQMKMYPKRITFTSLDEVEFFDSISGKPKIWYYRDNEGSFEFFNGSGFHPTYNVELKPVTTEIILSLKKKIEEKQGKAIAEDQIKQSANHRRKLIERLKRYINTGYRNQPISKEVAILVIDENMQERHDIEQNITSILKAGEKNPVLSLFKRPFIDEGLFAELFSGNLDIISSFNLNMHVDYIILVKKYSKPRTNPQVWDGVSSDLTFQIKIIDTGLLKVVNSTSISKIGAGFSNRDAEKNAIDHIYGDLKAFLMRSF